MKATPHHGTRERKANAVPCVYASRRVEETSRGNTVSCWIEAILAASLLPMARGNCMGSRAPDSQRDSTVVRTLRAIIVEHCASPTVPPSKRNYIEQEVSKRISQRKVRLGELTNS